MPKRILAISVLVACVLVTGAAAGDTITLGQTGADTDCTTGVDFVALQLSTSGGASYVVPPGKWTVTSWRAAGGSGGEEALVVFRPTADPAQYTVVGSTSPHSLPNALNTFTAGIDVEGGDLVGFWVQDGTRCALATGSGGDVVGLGISPGSPPGGGSTVSLVTGATGFRLNISATLKKRVGSHGGGSSPSSQPVAAPAPARIAICTAKPVHRADGTTGTFNDVLASQYPTMDPNSPYFGAVPANYVEGLGLTCDAPPGYVDAGYKVNGEGVRAPAGLEAVWFAPYEYYAKSP